MTQISFADILEAAEQLSLEDREDLIRILQNRLREQKRADLIRDVRETEQEFVQGKSQPVTPEQLNIYFFKQQSPKVNNQQIIEIDCL